MNLFYIHGTVQCESVTYKARKNRITRTITAWYRGEWCEPHPFHPEIGKSFTPTP